MKSGVLISLIWLTIKFPITKDLDIYLECLTFLVINCGLYHLKKNIQTIADDVSNILTTSKRSPPKL